MKFRSTFIYSRFPVKTFSDGNKVVGMPGWDRDKNIEGLIDPRAKPVFFDRVEKRRN